VELIAVVDEAEAAASAFGRWVLGAVGGFRPLGWAVRTDDLDSVVARLGLTPAEGSRATPGGGQLRWRYAGAEEAIARPPLPFFIEWLRTRFFPDEPPRAGRTGSSSFASRATATCSAAGLARRTSRFASTRAGPRWKASSSADRAAPSFCSR
jgi:glyoxalase-like protein